METRALSEVRWVRGVAVLVIGLVAAGAFAMSPAIARKSFSKKKALNLFYSKAGADARFVNVGEMASDADKLDGLNSTAFLGATAKATDSDQLDGQDSEVYKTFSRSVTNDPTGVFLDATAAVLVDLSTANDGAGDQRITTTRTSTIMATAVANLFTNTGTASEAFCRMFITPAGGSAEFLEVSEFDFPAVLDWNVEVPITHGVVKPAGTYDVGMDCREIAGSDLAFDQAALVVWAI